MVDIVDMTVTVLAERTETAASIQGKEVNAQSAHQSINQKSVLHVRAWSARKGYVLQG